MIIETPTDSKKILRLTVFSKKQKKALLTKLEEYHNITYQRTDFLSVVHDKSDILFIIVILMNYIVWSSYLSQKTGYLFDFFQSQ